MQRGRRVLFILPSHSRRRLPLVITTHRLLLQIMSSARVRSQSSSSKCYVHHPNPATKTTSSVSPASSHHNKKRKMPNHEKPVVSDQCAYTSYTIYSTSYCLSVLIHYYTLGRHLLFRSWWVIYLFLLTHWSSFVPSRRLLPSAGPRFGLAGV